MGEYKNINRGATVLAVGYNDTIVNGRVKYYPDRDGNLMIGQVDTFSRGGFRRRSYERDTVRVWVSDRVYIHDPEKDVTTYNPITGQDVTRWGYAVVNDSPDGAQRKQYNLDGSAKGRNRARSKLYDLVRCNWQLDCMVTLTFAADQVDRCDYDAIMAQLKDWLGNRVRRAGLCYVAVPEYHADGKAVHIHGLCNFDALATTYSGVKQHGRMVYNITDYPYGYTAVVRLGCTDADRQAVAAYVCKYITKGGAKVGGRYYLHGGQLAKPTTVLRELSDDDIAQLTATTDCTQWSCPTPMGTYTRYTIKSPKKPKNSPL